MSKRSAVSSMTGSLMAGLLLSGAALAQPSYQSGDIVKFFEDSSALGVKRSVCIGTSDDCLGNQPVSKGFDMLINFDLNSANLTDQARTNLDEFAKALKDERLKTATFVVEGYTDASGGAEYNERLSVLRARSVAGFLLERGVEQARVEAIGRGESSPRTTDPYDGANRRVEMRMKLN